MQTYKNLGRTEVSLAKAVIGLAFHQHVHTGAQDWVFSRPRIEP